MPASLAGAPQDEDPDAFAPVGGEKETDDGGSGLGKDGWAKVEAQWTCLEKALDDSEQRAAAHAALVASYGVSSDWLAGTRDENRVDADFHRKMEELVVERMEVDCPSGQLTADLRQRVGL